MNIFPDKEKLQARKLSGDEIQLYAEMELEGKAYILYREGCIREIRVLDPEGTNHLDKHHIVHREDGPAIIRLDTLGHITSEEYRWQSHLHREDGPARINYQVGSRPYSENYLIKDVTHRDGDLPAFQSYDEEGYPLCSEYYYQGNRHRKEGPAIIRRENVGSDGRPLLSCKVYFQNGIIHREGDLPSFTMYGPNGKVLEERWYCQDILQRESMKPTLIHYDSDGNILSFAAFTGEQGSTLTDHRGTAYLNPDGTLLRVCVEDRSENFWSLYRIMNPEHKKEMLRSWFHLAT